MAEEPNNDEREQKRELALIRLQNPFYQGLTAAKWGTWQEYGRLAEGIRERVIHEYSDDLAYRELIEPRLMADNSIQEHANQLVQASLTNITVKDVLGLMGSEINPNELYSEKYVSDLNEEERKAIIGAYIGNLTDNFVAETLGKRISSRRSGLEKIFSEEPSEN